MTVKNPIMKLFPVLKMTMTLNMLNGLIPPLSTNKGGKRFTKADYNRMIIYSIMWGVAGIYETKERYEIQELFKGKNYDLPKYKDNETMYDYLLSTTGDSVQWEKIELAKWEPPEEDRVLADPHAHDRRC